MSNSKDKTITAQQANQFIDTATGTGTYYIDSGTPYNGTGDTFALGINGSSTITTYPDDDVEITKSVAVFECEGKEYSVLIDWTQEIGLSTVCITGKGARNQLESLDTALGVCDCRRIKLLQEQHNLNLLCIKSGGNHNIKLISLNHVINSYDRQ